MALRRRVSGLIFTERLPPRGLTPRPRLTNVPARSGRMRVRAKD